MRLLLDQGLPRSTVAVLARAGWDVVHVADIGMSRAADLDILRLGRAERRTCVTLDADFHALLATSGERAPSVIRIRKEGLDGSALAALLQAVWTRVEAALATGRHGDDHGSVGADTPPADRQELMPGIFVPRRSSDLAAARGEESYPSADTAIPEPARHGAQDCAPGERRAPIPWAQIMDRGFLPGATA